MWQKVHLSKWLYICTAFWTLKSIMILVKWHLDYLLPANQAVYIKILYSELLEAASQHLWTRKKQRNEDRRFIYDSLPLLPRKMVIEYKIVRVKKASTLVEEMGMEWLRLSTFEELGMERLQKLQDLRAEYKCTYEAMWQCREGTLNAFETLKVQCMESNVILSGRVWGILTKKTFWTKCKSCKNFIKEFSFIYLLAVAYTCLQNQTNQISDLNN